MLPVSVIEKDISDRMASFDNGREENTRWNYKLH
jgi:hypothetical protein